MHVIQGSAKNQNKAIAIVASRFNAEITDALLDNALQRLKSLAYDQDLITVVRVSGAVEIGIAALRLAKTKKYAAIIVLGAVIKGETAHFDYVSEICSQTCQQIITQENIPIIYGVLNTFTLQQALARTNGEHSNMGVEAVDVALEMIDVCQQIS